MIDAIFFLLVFFMIASLSAARMRAIALALPSQAAPAPSNAPSGPGQPGGSLILTLNDSGQYIIGTHPMGADTNAVQNKLTSVLKSAPPRSVVLNFTGTQSTQALIGVLDILNRARTATGRNVPVLIATEPIDQNGRALHPASGSAPPPASPQGHLR